MVSILKCLENSSCYFGHIEGLVFTMFLLEVGFLVFEIDYMNMVSSKYVQAVLV